MKENVKTVLVIAPHPDDELNLAGQMIVALKEQDISVTVLFTTNGDADARIGNKRIMEAIRSAKVLGIPQDNVIFLGYANEWQGERHIYNGSHNKVILSKLGKWETNGLPCKADYSFQKNGKHNCFTRQNFKRDLKSCIQEYHADMLICVDYDSHPDHRAASLMFDEVMGEILKEDPEYRPVVLKKYAYNGVWKGNKDYYLDAPTRIAAKHIEGRYELDSPFFSWEERICFEAPKATRTERLMRNILFKAACRHKSTTAWYQMLRVLNSDIVYWKRSTNSLLMKSNVKISASSGNTRFLNDFKLYDATNVLLEHDSIDGTCCSWIPDPDDNMPSIRVDFADNHKIGNIRIYQLCDQDNHIDQIQIKYADAVYTFDVLKSGADVIDLELDAAADRIEVIVSKYTGRIMVTELELFPDSTEADAYRIPVPLVEKDMDARRSKETLPQKIEKICLMFLFLIKFKLKYEAKKFWYERIRSKKN